MQVHMPETDLTAQDLAKILDCSPRMVNLYRASIERRITESTGTPTVLGYKSGKQTFFRPEEQQLIRSERERNVSAADVGAKAQQQAAASPKETMQDADEVANGSMSTMVAQLDRQAAAMGDVVGDRFVGIMAASMSAAIARGMTGLQQSMMEMTAGLQTAIPVAPAIAGGTAAALPAAAEPSTIPSLESLQDD
jgi:hypothetical protein